MQRKILLLLLFSAILLSGCIDKPSIEFSGEKELVIAKNISFVQDSTSFSLSKNYDYQTLYLPQSTVLQSLLIQPLTSELKSFTILSKTDLLEENLNKEIEIIYDSKTYTGTLISIYPLLLKTDTQIIELKNYDLIKYPITKYSKDLQLSLELFSDTAKKETVNYSYLLSDIYWQPSYSLFIDNSTSLLTSNFIIQNNTDKEFTDFSLSLSTSQTSPSYYQTRSYIEETYASDYAGKSYDSYQTSELTENYLYTIKENQTIQPNSTLSIPFLSANPSFKTEYYINTSYYTNKGYANLKYIIENTQANSLGQALPSGTLTLYEKKNSVFVPIKELTIQNTQENKDLELNTGNTFNLSYITTLKEENQYHKDNDYCTKTKTEVKILSSESQSKEVITYFSIPSNATIIDSPNYTLENSTTMKIPTQLPANSEKTFYIEIESCYPLNNTYKSYPETDYSEIQ